MSIPTGILLKNVKLAKTGKRYVLTIPSDFIHHELIKPEQEYDVEFKASPKKEDKDEEDLE